MVEVVNNAWTSVYLFILVFMDAGFGEKHYKINFFQHSQIKWFILHTSYVSILSILPNFYYYNNIWFY